MTDRTLDDIRHSVLDRMERGERVMRLSLFGAAALEALMFVVAFRLVDWDNRLHLLIFLFSVFTYFIVILGLVALAGHVSRSAARVIAAIEASTSR